MPEQHLLLAFGLTIFAGLSTGIGGAFAVLTRSFSNKFLAGSLGFSAGVMIYVSFMEIMVKAAASLTAVHGAQIAQWYTVLAFFGGIILIGVIDRLVPSAANPHEHKDLDDTQQNAQKLMRMGLFAAFAIALHNFPEGLATFIATLQDPSLGLSIALAIAIHNIPEGIAVAVPIYYATKHRGKAFLASLLSGVAEPIGALIGYFLLLQFFSDSLMGILFAMVAGVMVYISLDELLPTAEKYGEHHVAIYGLIGGMAVMAMSLLLFL